MKGIPRRGIPQRGIPWRGTPWRGRESCHLCLCQPLHLPSHVTKILPKLFWGLGSFFSIFGIIDVHGIKSSSCFFLSFLIEKLMNFYY